MSGKRKTLLIWASVILAIVAAVSSLPLFERVTQIELRPIFERGVEHNIEGHRHLALVEYGIEYKILVIPADDKWDWKNPLEAYGSKVLRKASIGDDGLILQWIDYSSMPPKRIFPLKLYFRRQNVFVHVHLKLDENGAWPKEVPFIDEKQQADQLEKIGKAIDDAIVRRAPQVRFARISIVGVTAAKVAAFWDQCIFFVIGGGKDTNPG